MLNVDNIAHLVPDIETASAALGQLGFALTPFSLQTTKNEAGESVPAGAGNRCVMLERGYLGHANRSPNPCSPWNCG